MSREILVASAHASFADAVVAALSDEGALVVRVEELDALADALRMGFRPDAILLDGTLPDVAAFAAALRRIPPLATTPLVAASPAMAFATDGIPLVRRDVHTVVEALDGACGRADVPPP